MVPQALPIGDSGIKIRRSNGRISCSSGVDRRIGRCGERRRMLNAIILYLSSVLILSIASFVLYGLDKRRAVHGGRRVPEFTLQLLAFLGGWPGALFGQRQFRHKTKKTPFLIVFWFLVVAHVALVGGGAYAIFVSP